MAVEYIGVNSSRIARAIHVWRIARHFCTAGACLCLTMVLFTCAVSVTLSLACMGGGLLMLSMRLYANHRVLRLWRHQQFPLCPRCEYDLRAHDVAACPECGYHLPVDVRQLFTQLRSATREPHDTSLRGREV